MPMGPLRTGWLLARRNRPGETALGVPTELSAFTALPSFHVPAASEGGRLMLSGQLHLLSATYLGDTRAVDQVLLVLVAEKTT